MILWLSLIVCPIFSCLSSLQPIEMLHDLEVLGRNRPLSYSSFSSFFRGLNYSATIPFDDVIKDLIEIVTKPAMNISGDEDIFQNDSSEEIIECICETLRILADDENRFRCLDNHVYNIIFLPPGL